MALFSSKTTATQQKFPFPVQVSLLYKSEFSINNLLIQRPERPKKLKTMVVTSWRSGSTLIGELLNSYPKSFYTYEPLTLAGIRRVYDGDTLANASINIMVILMTSVRCYETYFSNTLGRNSWMSI